MARLLATILAIFAAGALAVQGQLLNQGASESDARLVKTEGDAWSAGFKLTRCWAWVAGAASSGNTVKDLVTTLNSVTNYTNPMANGTNYLGTFVNSEVWSTDEESDTRADRHVSIFQTCTRIKTITDVASLGVPIKNADKILLNFMEFQEGLGEHIYHIYPYLDPNSRAACMSLSPVETGYVIVKREFKIEKDRTGTLIITFENNTWHNLAGSAPNRVQAVSNTYEYANWSPRDNVRGLTVQKTLGADGLASNAVEEVVSNIAAETASSGCGGRRREVAPSASVSLSDLNPPSGPCNQSESTSTSIYSHRTMRHWSMQTRWPQPPIWRRHPINRRPPVIRWRA
jgi:hypothetical protein